MKNKYIEVLNYLYGFGINQKEDISHLFNDYCLHAKEPGDLLVMGHRLNIILDFLQGIQNDGFIDFNNFTAMPNGNIIPWVFPVKIEASITAKGFEYMDRYNLNVSLLSVNGAAEKNYESQKTLSIVTIIIAVLAATFSIADFFKAEPKMVELNKNIRGLSKQTEGIKQEIDSLRSHLTSPKGSSRKH